MGTLGQRLLELRVLQVRLLDLLRVLAPMLLLGLVLGLLTLLGQLLTLLGQLLALLSGLLGLLGEVDLLRHLVSLLAQVHGSLLRTVLTLQVPLHPL